MDLVFGYLAGLLTLLNPCVVPILPIVLAGALQSGRTGPLALAGGMSVSFVGLGLFVAAMGPAFGIYPETVSAVAAILMMIFGAVLMVPRLSAGFATATAGISARSDAGVGAVDRTSVSGQFLGGLLMGAVWSPCIGPTLGGAIALASQGQRLAWAGAIMAAFALGVSTLIIGIGYGAHGALTRHQPLVRAIAARARPILGVVFFGVGLALFFNLNHVIEAWALDTLPTWLTDASVAL